MADLTREQKLSGLTGVTDIVDLLSKVNLVQYKTGWTSKHLAADAIREITRLRQLLSEAQKREREARAAALEEAAKVAEDKAQAWSTSKGGEIDACLDTAAAIRALQSEEP